MTVTVRLAREPDAQQLFDLQHAIDTESEFLYVSVGERSTDVTVLAARLAAVDQPGTFTVLAFDEPAAVGFCTVTLPPFARLAGLGVITIAIRAAAQSRGAGRALLELAIGTARSRGLTRLELTVRADNAVAIRLYERVGFVQEGLRRQSFCAGGVLHDELWMGLLL